jgi:predicted Zn-dependent peptidase
VGPTYKEVKSEAIGKSYILAQHQSGLKIFLYQMPGFTTHYGMFGTRYGSIDNSFENEKGETVNLPEGIAHFLEHKLFESEDGDAFTKYAKTGAYSNAYTSFDRTCYLFSCSNRFYDNLGILLDFVRSPYFTAETVKKEQGIIGQEIRMYDDQPSWQVLFNMLGAMYKNHPVKTDIAGTVESIAKITDTLLYDCYNRFYDLSNMFIVLAGDFKVEEVLEFIEKNLKVSDTNEVKTTLPHEPEDIIKPYVECNLDVAIPLFCIGFKEILNTPCPTAKKAVAMVILLKMLVGSASPLYKKLLDEQLINEDFAHEYFTGRGIAIPMFEGESKNPKRVLELILNEIESYKNGGMNPKLFEAARREMYGNVIRRFDGAESVCSMLSDATILGYDLFEHIELIKNITLKDLEEVLPVLSKEKAVLSVVRAKTEG